MTGIVDWAASRARMVLAFILLSLVVGGYAYSTLPKEGEPDIEIPALFVSVPFPGISASDSETLLVKPMETQLADLDGLKKMSGTAAENYAGVALEFEFGWDKTKITADVRDAMSKAEADFPSGAEQYTINEINFSEFNPKFTGTYFEHVHEELAKRFPVGRTRVLSKGLYNCNSWHRDPEPRLHIPIISNPGSLFVVNHHCTHLPADGSVYFTDTRGYHTALNGGEESRVHIVAALPYAGQQVSD